MIAYWDQDLRNVLANSAYIDWFGISPQDMPGKHIRDVIGEELFALNEPYMRQALKGVPQHFERRIVDAAGDVRYSQASYLPDLDEHGVQGFFVLVTDITAHKVAEVALAQARDAAEKSSQAFEAFSYSVAHDLRAPLRAINGFSEMLTHYYAPVLDEKGLHYLDRVHNSAQQMAELIDALLVLARTNHRELVSTNVDLSEIATIVLKRMQQETPERSVRVCIQPGLTACGDQVLLANALENLLGNAWKFSCDQPDAQIEFGRDQDEYFVRDNGSGFDMAHSAKLFGVFQRLHSSQEFEGTGIGLATVLRIIRRHGGQIRAEGVVGHGATFYFTLAEAPTPVSRSTPA